MTNVALLLDNVSIAYGKVIAVTDVSLSVEQGEFISILGPSGCGKTTVLRTIAGFVPVHSGSISINGMDATTQPPEVRDVGIVFQNYALFPNLTAFENIAFGLRVARVDRAEIDDKVNQIATVAGIQTQLQKRPAELSGGQQQRVAVARSMVTGARVLLFDEPFSNLDTHVREELRREVKRLQDSLGFSAVFVTHDQEEALSLSDRIVVMQSGVVEQIGTPSDIYYKPRSKFVCSFVGGSNELDAQTANQLTGVNHFKASASMFVRPEDIVVVDNASSGIDALVEHIEFLGLTTRIFVRVNERSLVVTSLSGHVARGVKAGDSIKLSANPERAHVF